MVVATSLDPRNSLDRIAKVLDCRPSIAHRTVSLLPRQTPPGVYTSWQLLLQQSRKNLALARRRGGCTGRISVLDVESAFQQVCHCKI